MEKKVYEKPEMQVVILQHQANLLVGSSKGGNADPTDDADISDYNDVLG